MRTGQDNAGKAEREDAGRLYHRDEAPPGRRGLFGHKPKPPPPRRGRKTPHESLWPSIRILLVVLLIMGGLLYAARLYSLKAWEKKTRAARTRSVPDKKPTPPPDRESAPGLLQDTALSPSDVAAPALDSSALRRAVFLLEQGDTFEEEGNYAQAAKMYREALDLWPNLEDAWPKLGRACLQAGDYEQARTALARAVKEHPGDPKLLNDLGVASLFLKRPDKAVESFNKAIEADATFAKSYYNLALSYLTLDDQVRARNLLQTYLSLQPENARAMRQIAYIDAAQGRYEQALATIEEALAIEPNWAPLYLDRAAALALLDRYDESLAALREAEARSDPDTVHRQFMLPAFEKLRATGKGRAFEAQLAERAAREERTPAPPAASASGNEPLVSVEPSPTPPEEP